MSTNETRASISENRFYHFEREEQQILQNALAMYAGTLIFGDDRKQLATGLISEMRPQRLTQEGSGGDDHQDR